MIDREKVIDELFARAVELPPEQRQALFIDESHRIGEDLVGEVKALLRDHVEAEAKGFLQQPLISTETDEPTHVLSVGQDFEGYKILSLIEEGGMGEVYLAQDKQLERKVAIKLIKSHLKTKEVLRRFHNERQILANLQHPNIAQLFEARATADGLPFFVMEYVEGKSIDKFVAEHELAVNDLLKLFRTVCSAVSYAHQNLVIHRDIKPGNILVAEKSEPKLLDFGIAKLLHESDSEPQDATATLFRVMTPEYASPEQVKGEPVTTATDVYSLAVLLYELLTGHRPYKLKRRTTEEITKAICEQEPERPSVAVTRGNGDGETRAKPNRQLKGDLDNIVLKALRKDPQRRYTSVEQFSEDIRRHLEGLPVSARKDTIAYRTSKFVQRNKIGVAAAAIILLTLIGGIIGTAWQAHKARVESARAQQRFNEVRQLAHSVLFDYHDAIASLPGSTPLRERLVSDALKYLDGLAHDPGNSQSLQRELATAYLKVGDVQGRPYTSNLGETEAALASYQKALAILERLSASNERNTELTRDLATVYERIGNVQLRKGNGNDALDKNNKALAMRQALLAADPSNKQYRREVADSYLYVGDALQAKCLDLECMRTALEDSRLSLDIRQALAKEDPSDVQIRRDVAQAYARIGFRLWMFGQKTGDKKYFQQWLESDQAALMIRKELATVNPTNVLDRRNLADELMATANAQLANGDIAGALAAYRDSLDIFKALSAADPTNSEALRDLSFIYFRLAVAYGQANNARAARENYAEVLRVDEPLLAQDATNVEDRQNVFNTLNELSELSKKNGDWAGAFENWRKSIDVCEKIVALGPDTPSHLNQRATAYRLMGNLLAGSAGAHLTNGILDEPIPPPTNAKQAQELHEAKDWFQKSLDACQDMKRKGLHTFDIDLIALEISRCDAALAKGH